MKNPRKKWLLPIAVFAIAIAGVFASNIEKSNDTTVNWGYTDNPRPCMVKVACSVIPGPVCTSGGLTAKFFNSGGTLCDQPAFQIQH